MYIYTIVLLACLPSALLAVKCTDPPNNTTDTATDTLTDGTTPEDSTEPPTTTAAIPPPETWPSGKFSLPMAGEDCPDFYGFKKGWFYQDTEDNQNVNSWPGDTAMIGPFKKDGYRFNFCTKVHGQGTYRFEPGNYCIYQFSKRCAPGFKPGSIMWDDEDDFNQNARKGRVPYGKYTEDTTKVHFCCRDDGQANQAIALPITKPFYMLRYTAECQKVRYMAVKEEIFVWDDQDGNTNKNAVDGAVPMNSGSSADHILHFCLYEPI